MSRRRKPPRRMVVFRCPEELYQKCEPIFHRLRGGRSAYMVASLLALLTKLGKEGVVEPIRRVPRTDQDGPDAIRRFRYFDT